MEVLDQIDRLLDLVSERVPKHRPFAEDGQQQWWALNEFGATYCQTCNTVVDIADVHKCAWRCGLCGWEFNTSIAWARHAQGCAAHRGSGSAVGRVR